MAALGAAGALCLGELVAAGGLAQAALGRADRCGPVLQMQQELSRRTYSVGPLDGIFGPQTEFAVRRFQANQGLPVTGQVAGATAIALGLPQGVSCNPVAQASHRVATPGTSLNRRDRPSGTVLDQLADRTPVVVVETQMGWSRLQQGGWVASNFLVPLGSGSLGQNSTAQSSAGGGGGSNGGGNTLFIPPSQGGISTNSGGGGGGGQSPAPGTAVGNAGGGPGCTHTALVTARAGLQVRNAPAGAVVTGLDEGEAICLTGEGRAASQRFWAKLQSGNWVASDFLRLLN